MSPFQVLVVHSKALSKKTSQYIHFQNNGFLHGIKSVFYLFYLKSRLNFLIFFLKNSKIEIQVYKINPDTLYY